MGAKRQRVNVVVQNLEQEGWKVVDNSKECFIISDLPVDKAFLTFNIPLRAASLFHIFNKFVDEVVIGMLYDGIHPDLLVLERTSDLKVRKKIDLHAWKLWQTYAIIIRIIGRQEKSCENERVHNMLYKVQDEALLHFSKKFMTTTIGKKDLRRHYNDNNAP